ncbi:hypothetical protein [Candidatus Coxiella mudrowiae]|nr:hypothetical protein [Candidatus Coxiella mudrowiae]
MHIWEDVVIGPLATVIRMMASLRDGLPYGVWEIVFMITVLNFGGV